LTPDFVFDNFCKGSFRVIACSVRNIAASSLDVLLRSATENGMAAVTKFRSTGLRRVLIVEDDYFIANELAHCYAAQGVNVAGPAPDATTALRLLEEDPNIDLAIVDIMLRDGLAYDLADELRRRACPFVFATGMETQSIPERFADVPVITKPYMAAKLLSLVHTGVPTSLGIGNNALLARMPRNAIERLRPHMMRVAIIPRRIVVRAGHSSGQTLFPLAGVYSLLMGAASNPAEVALVGREGFVEAGFPTDKISRYHVWGQGVGGAVAISSAEFYSALRDSTRLRDLVERYRYVLALQMSEVASSNATDKVRARLARWLLSFSDRVGDSMPVVHEFLSNMLHVRRAGITEAIHQLEGLGAIKASRGQLILRDRSKLLECVGSTYGISNKAYEELILSLPLEADRAPILSSA
jgi:CheY-like chemotaxis protein